MGTRNSGPEGSEYEIPRPDSEAVVRNKAGRNTNTVGSGGGSIRAGRSLVARSELDPEFKARGIHVAVGTTGTGKTYLMHDIMKRLRMPRLVIDSAGAENWRNIPHAKTLAQVGADLSRQRKGNWGPPTYWTPQSVDDVDLLFSTILRLAESGKGGPMAVLIDEISYWTVESKSKELRKALRLWRHWQGTIFVTSQHVSADLGQVMQAENPYFFLFRTTSSRSLLWLERELEVPREVVLSLPDRTWLEMRV